MSNFPVGITALGTIVWSNIILEGLVINDAKITLSQRKNVVITDIAGRNGSVKEYINTGDYNIRVQGMLVAEVLNVFPNVKVKEFRRICELEREIIVSSSFLNHFNITKVVILDYQVAEQEAIRNAVPFTLEMVSDTPIEIKVNA